MQRLDNSSTAHFALGGQTGGFNHNHAMQMGHAAALRQQAARALSGKPDVASPHLTGGPTGVPGGPPQGAAAAPPVNYKAAIATHMARQGKMVGVPHIHAAIDSMAAKGHITHFQASALKQHNGPLVGPQGQATQVAIMNHMLGGQ